MHDLRTLPSTLGCQDLNLPDSRFFDPLSMDVYVSRRQGGGMVASKRDGAQLPSPVRRPPGATDSRNALKAAIEHYGDVRQLGGHSAAVKRALAACMQLLDQK